MNFHNFKKSVRYSWMISYVSIMVFFLVAILGVSFYFGTIIQTKFKNENYSILKQIQLSFESHMTKMQALVEQIISDRDVQELLRKKDLPTKAEQFDIYLNMRSKITAIQSSNPEYELFFYFNNWNMIITGTGMSSPVDFYRMKFRSMDDYAAWEGEFTGSNANRFLSRRNTPEGEESIYLIKPLTFFNHENVSQSVVITAYEKDIVDSFSNLITGNDANVMICNNEGDIFVSSLKDQDMLSSIPFKTEPFYNFKCNGMKYVMLSESSLYSKWRYYIMIPQKVYMGNTNLMRISIYVSSLLSLLVSIGLSVYFIKRNYMPLGKLLSSISVTAGDNNAGRNEYDAIESAIKNLSESSSDLFLQINKLNMEIKNSYAEKLLKGNLQNEGQVAEEAFHFPADSKFVVMIFGIYEQNTYSNREVHVITKNIAEEIASEYYSMIVFNVDDMLTGLVCIRDTVKGDNEIKDDLANISTRVLDAIKTYFGIELTVSVSGINVGAETIADAYNEASDAVQYRHFTESKEIIFYTDFAIEETHGIYYPIHVEQQLIYSIKTGNEEKVHEIIEELINKNRINGTLIPKTVKRITLSFSATLLRISDELLQADDAAEFPNPVSLLETCRTMEDFKDALLSVTKAFTQSGKITSRANKTSSKVISFIEKNYTSPDLTVSSLADEFNLSAVHLSRLFKEQTGMGLLDFINNYRITQSTKVLEETELPIDAIALQVGYENNGTYRRLFKKYLNLTPGQYRQNKQG